MFMIIIQAVRKKEGVVWAMGDISLDGMESIRCSIGVVVITSA